MSTWGIRTFENDDATDWIDGFARDPNPRSLAQALLISGSPTDEVPSALPAQDAHIALAAAEVIAAWCGRPAPELPPSVTAWLLGRTEAVTSDLLSDARNAVERIAKHSDLREAWDSSHKLKAWQGALDDLRERLGTASAAAD